ncbi:hypothetical protein ACFFYR_36200 [Paraburkholderia dipogonis]|uniref:hypothetical protein n=1 Tax=Paraburkholderia dipogonis TaxID=1211383 RepID=UPI0035E8F8F3
MSCWPIASAKIGQAMGGAQPVIERASWTLSASRCSPASPWQSVDADGVELTNGRRIDAATVIWCGAHARERVDARKSP